MDIVSVCMNVGTILAAIGTLPQIMAVWKDRSILNGYNPLACFVLCTAMVLFTVAFFSMGYWLSVLAEVPCIIFWGMSSFLSYRRQRK